MNKLRIMDKQRPLKFTHEDYITVIKLFCQVIQQISYFILKGKIDHQKFCEKNR